MLKTAVLISFISMMIGALSLINQILIAHALGTSASYDAYLIGCSVPFFFIGITASYFNYSMVPRLALSRSKKSDDPDGRVSLYLLLLLAFDALLTSTTWLSSPAIVKFIAPRLSGNNLSSAIEVARISWLTVSACIFAQFLIAVHNSRKLFLISTLANCLPYLGMISVSLSERYTPILLAWGMLFGYSAAVVLLFIPLIRGLKAPSEHLKLFDEIRALVYESPLVLLSLTCFTIYGVADAYWAPRLGEGALSSLGYCQRFLIGIGNLIILAPSTMMVPYLATHLAIEDKVNFERNALLSIRLVLSVASLFAVLIYTFRYPFIQLIFEHGNFTPSSTEYLCTLLPWMLAGMVAMLGSVMAMKALHAAKRLRYAATFGLLCSASYFLISGALIDRFGVHGICIAYACSWWVTLSLSMLALHTESVKALLSDTVLYVGKLGLALTVAYALSESAYRMLSHTIEITHSMRDLWPIAVLLALNLVGALGFGCVALCVLKLKDFVYVYERFVRIKNAI